MLFNSFSFLAFFAAFVVVYYAVPQSYRWALLLVASLCFYATFRASYVLLLTGLTLIAYTAALSIDAAHSRRRKRVILTVGVVAELGPLVVFKYYDFLARTLDTLLANLGVAQAGPLFPRLDLVAAAGLSFYTFSCVSYLADVDAGRLPAERHLGRFTLYVSFFPKLLAGPIERAKPFLSQVTHPVWFNGVGITTGLQLMLWGLFKKVVIADRLAVMVDAAYRQPLFSPPADLVIATYFFAFQIYCDFSGYSDIAIGAARVLGFDLIENFRRPYFSTSIREFWARRWHVSLAGWFRDYMYIPMGGNRVSGLRQSLNVMAVFLASGLWHGANWTFVVWGGLNGCYQIASLIGSRAGPRRTLHVATEGSSMDFRLVAGNLLRRLLTFHLILVTWVFFRAATLADAATIVSRMARSLGSLPRLLQARMTSEILLSLGLIVVLLGVEALDEQQPFWQRLSVRPLYVRWAVYYALLLGLIVLGTWNVRQFIYMQF